jgi:hypothetical protein
VEEPVEDVIAACQKLQELPRKEGEAALPELGVFLATTKAETVARQNRRVTDEEAEQVEMACDLCGTWYSTFLRPGVNISRRYCRAKKPGPKGTICGGSLIEKGRGYTDDEAHNPMRAA